MIDVATFADYTFYVSRGGQLSEAAYNAAVGDAYAEILSQTNGAANTAPDTMQEAVKLCECALVDVIASYRDAAAMLPRGVGSVSNDSYTVTAGAASSLAAPMLAEARERAAICARYLQWPVNLMCRWI